LILAGFEGFVVILGIKFFPVAQDDRVVGEAVSMTETFITHIRVDKVRNVKNLDIPLSGDERKHLIITGKNGSGKTSLLKAIYPCFEPVWRSIADKTLRVGGISVELSQRFPPPESPLAREQRFITFFFEAKRQSNFLPSEGPKKLNLNEYLNVSEHFIQYMVNEKTQRSFARDDGDEQSAKKIDDWFLRFEAQLKNLFSTEKLELRFDRKNYDFSIVLEDREPFRLSELSDGYSAVMYIITEIMLRMEATKSSAYDVEGIVIVDEIETHLHVELQKKILPFLCEFFPRIQFIVSTHSPFVLSSVENAVICDLQNRIVTEDLSGYSYDALIESFFKSDKYSDILKCKVARYEALADMPEKSDREMDEYFELKHELSNLPKYLAPELDVKLKQIELKHLS
jgi:predicted ATP-dependent endonuclease of OLD family